MAGSGWGGVVVGVCARASRTPQPPYNTPQSGLSSSKGAIGIPCPTYLFRVDQLALLLLLLRVVQVGIVR